MAFVYGAVRTPFGRYAGALADTRPDDLAATVLTALLERAGGLEPDVVDEVLLGNANGAGEENRNVARMATLLAGFPVTVPGATINRLCGSSLDAAMTASRLVDSGDADVVIAGGVESMSRAPWVLPKPSRAYPSGDLAAVSTTLGWRLVNPRMPSEWTVSLGEANEQLQEKFAISRERQDEFALESHRTGGCSVGQRLLRRSRGRRTRRGPLRGTRGSVATPRPRSSPRSNRSSGTTGRSPRATPPR